VDFLRWVALGESVDLGSEIVVIGGGNVAYDVARTVVRQIAYDTARTAARLPGTRQVRLASLETLEEMPADTVEIREGDEEGIERLNGWGPVEIQRDAAGTVTGVVFQRCLRVYDEQGRFAPHLEDGGKDVEQFRQGWPTVDSETLASTAPGVFVAGDLAHGTRLIIDAVASGKQAARSIYSLVTGHAISMEAVEAHIPIEPYERERGFESIGRVEVPTLSPEERLADPNALVEAGYSEEQARSEASRCLDCGVTPVFDGSRCVLCGGCADVCPTVCLALVAIEDLDIEPGVKRELLESVAGSDPDVSQLSTIIKDEDRCIRCGLCAERCPVEAISMERVQFNTQWRSP
jgi:NADPH-dependent glutamate synthase beta subunit-like oxidoreductase